MRRLSELLDEEDESYLFGLLRLLLGLLLCVQTYKICEETQRSGYFGHFFHLPLLPAAWVPSESVYFALLAVEFGGGLLAVVGLLGRGGLFAAALAGIYVLLCDRLHYHNNRFALFLFAFLCAFTPCDRSFLLFRGRRHALADSARRAPIWARQLIKFQVSAIYLASSCGKLLDPDWRSGIAMLPRFQKGLAPLARPESLAPSWLIEALSAPWFAGLLSKAAITVEFFLAFALWFPRTRVLALWLGFAFHLGIELSARVQLFSWLMGAAYLAFVTPKLRERELRFDPASKAGRVIARLAPFLDWLARFRLTAVTPGAGVAFSVVDRDGKVTSGFGAVASLARAVPLLFPFWPALALAARALAARSRGA